MAAKDVLGTRGEDLALDYLKQRGFALIERNWRCRAGEVDIIMRDGETLVFVEVKTRSGLGFGHPFEAITAAKRSRLRKLAGIWCSEHESGFPSLRIDAVAVLAPAGGAVAIEHLAGVC